LVKIIEFLYKKHEIKIANVVLYTVDIKPT